MTSPTLDCLNQHRAPRLEDLILAEIFLAGGPCYIHRLWSEMFERQKSISAGRIIFAREVIRMERDGLLQQHEGDRTAITNQGKVHLFGLVLLGMIPDEQKRRLESKGVLGVALQGAAGVGGGGLNVAPLGEHTVKGNPFPENERTSVPVVTKGLCADSKVLDGLQVGSNGGGASPILSSPPFPSDERFADNISRALDTCEFTEQKRLEEIEAESESADLGGYRDPAEDRSFA